LNSHEQYEELCALAASGQASPAELTDLRAHLEDCPSCRAAAYDFNQISAQGLSQIAARRLRCEIPSGMTQRFVARARSEGIEMTRDTVPLAKKPGRGFLAVSVSAVAAALLVAIFLAVATHKSHQAILGPDRLPAHQSAVASSGESAQSAATPDRHLHNQIASTQAELESLRATLRTQHAELDSLNSRLATAGQDNIRIQSEKAQKEDQIAELEGEIETARLDKNANDVELALQGTELRELRKKIADQTEASNQQEALAAGGSDVRDLVVARNLHIIDVHDRDGNGKNQRPFGRIFYTEGKSLIFYAYDLADPAKVDAKVSFYVWGERLGAEKPVSSLGIFHNDDANDARWVLTFDDPHVLARINSVFVTVETARKSIREPGGRRILFAFLGDKPNHP
jgi:hypothetical protein